MGRTPEMEYPTMTDHWDLEFKRPFLHPPSESQPTRYLFDSGITSVLVE